MLHPDFDQQARDLMTRLHDYVRVDLSHDCVEWDDPDSPALISSALRAAYRAGMERGAVIAEGCCYGREAAVKIREEME